MSTTASPNQPCRERGFTLIEVMVVVLIIGILLAVGIPTFLSARTQAQDRAAQAALGTARTVVPIALLEGDGGNYSYFFELNGVEESNTWVWHTNLSTGPQVISVTTIAASKNWSAAVLSDSGTCFLVRQLGTGETFYGTTTPDRCNGFNAYRIPADPSW